MILSSPGYQWLACHISYGGRLDRLVRECVVPIVRSSQSNGDLDAWFFMRYSLGGPHIRLRCSIIAGGEQRWREAASAECKRFFLEKIETGDYPSRSAILARNRFLCATDPMPGGCEDQLYADKSCSFCSPVFEIERYGGSRLFPDTLKIFCLSSDRISTLLLEREDGEGGDSRYRHFIYFASMFLFHLSRDAQHAAELLRGMIEIQPFGTRVQQLALKEFSEREVGYLGVVKAGCFSLDDNDTRLRSALRVLGVRLGRESSPKDIKRIVASHIHMLGNRLGLSCGNEVYFIYVLLYAWGSATVAKLPL